jgi:hypothetical protein
MSGGETRRDELRRDEGSEKHRETPAVESGGETARLLLERG